MQRHNVRGHVKIALDGRVVFEDHNLVTNAGIVHIAALINGVETTPFQYVALGIGTGPADIADEALESEKADDGAARVLASTIDMRQSNIPDDTARLIATFDIVDDFDLSEIGLFNAASGGVLGARRVFSPIAILADQTVTVTWTLTVTAEEELVP